MPVIQDSLRGTLQNVYDSSRNNQFVHELVAPKIINAPLKGRIYKDVPDDWKRIDEVERAYGAAIYESSYQTAYADYTMKQYAAAVPIAKEDIENQQAHPDLLPPVDLMVTATELAKTKIQGKLEKVTAEAVTGATWCGGNNDAEGLWAATDSTNTFFADIQLGRITVNKKTGYIPNTLVMDYGTWSKLMQNASITASLADNVMQRFTTGMLAELLQVEEIIIASAVKSTDEEKKGGASMTNVSYFWEANAGKGSAFLFYKPKSPSLMSGGAILTPTKKDIDFDVYYENGRRSYVTSVAQECAVVTVNTNLGYLFTDTIVT